MATAAFDDAYQAQDSLSCGVCFEKYKHFIPFAPTPPCLHTFCSSCINSLATEGGNDFECPVCRSKASSEGVRTNLAVRDIVEELHAKQRERENTKIFCSDHSGRNAQWSALIVADLCVLCV